MGFSKDDLQMAKKHLIEGYFPVRDTERLHTVVTDTQGL